MSVSHRYRNFSTKSTKKREAPGTDDSDLEDQKLQSFEAGYQAGWDDATKAQVENQNRISAEFAQNLQEISFSYHEAVTKLSGAFEPILKEIVGKLLPEISKQTMGLHIFEQLNTLLEQSIDKQVEIVVSPSNQNKIRALAQDGFKDPFVLVTDQDMSDDEVFVRVGEEEKQIDLGGILESVGKATEAFFHEVKEQQKNG